MKRLPPQTRGGGNAHAFAGGFRLWERQYRNAAGPARAVAGNQETT